MTESYVPKTLIYNLSKWKTEALIKLIGKLNKIIQERKNKLNRKCTLDTQSILNCCPCCGSFNIERKEKLDYGLTHEGIQFTYIYVTYKCTACTEEFYSPETDENYLIALQNSC